MTRAPVHPISYSRVKGVVALWCAAAALACAEPDSVRVRLITSSQLDPSAFERIQVVVRDDRGAPVASGRLGNLEDRVAPGTVDLGDLEVGATYQVRVVADTALCAARGRAVGDSRRFTHRDGDYDIPVSLGCAEELVATRRRPNVSRVGHTLTADGSQAVVTGGGRSARFAPDARSLFVAEGAVPLVERYDPESQQFLPAESLVAVRTRPAGVRLSSGGVGVMGGATDNPLACSNAVERTIGLSVGTSELLSVPRCTPAAVYLPAVDLTMVVGSPFSLQALTDRTFDAELYDGALQRRVRDGIAGLGLRLEPEAVPLRDGRSALVIGGAPPNAGTPAAERFTMDDSCPDGCFVEVSGGPDGWIDAASVRVDCVDGGSLVLSFGGAHGDPIQPVDDVWCYEDSPQATLQRAPVSLPAPRRGAAAVLVQVDQQLPRVLVIGGTSENTLTSSSQEAPPILFDVAECGCSSLRDPETVTYRPPVPEILIGHDAVRLDDGSVLVVGGVSVLADGAGAEATGGAFLFYPDRDL